MRPLNVTVILSFERRNTSSSIHMFLLYVHMYVAGFAIAINCCAKRKKECLQTKKCCTVFNLNLIVRTVVVAIY
jgi:hypothetical protein